MRASSVAVPLAVLGAASLAAFSARGKATDDGGGNAGDARDDVPARALSVGESLKILDRYVERNVLRGYSRKKLDVGGVTTERVTFSGNPGGVQFTYGNAPQSIHDVDPRFAVLLVRLALFLRERGVTTIRTLGIYPGAGSADDVHNQGRAIDLSGVVSEDEGPLDVLENWGLKSAPYATGATTTSYRLHQGDPGFSIFRDIYEFATEQGSDRTDAYVADEGPPTTIGDHSFVITPDHPSPALRAAHQNHFHIQIGPTHVKG